MPRLDPVAWLESVVARVRSLGQAFRTRRTLDAEMEEEFRAHIELRAADLRREGVSQEEALKRAHREFGHMETHREAARASRGLRWMDQIGFSMLDVRLGLRMLVKHPGLTVVAVFALAVGIPVGLAPWHLAEAIEAPLPEDSENRIRSLRFWDPVTTGLGSVREGDFELWSEELKSFSRLGAFRPAALSLAAEGGPSGMVPGAQLTPSIFELLRTRALLGRSLVPADARRGAPDVAVLGHEVWVSRFSSDPDVVGTTVLVGNVPHAVVGVMPPGFRFPINQQLWLPLALETGSAAGSSGVRVIGRIADGVSEVEARAELETVARRSREDMSEVRARLIPEIVPFGLAYVGVARGGLSSEPGFVLFQMLALGVLLVACANVAMLLFARTATRFRELAVRTALGASRARILSQMFVESLVLSLVAAGTGLLSTKWLLGRINLAGLAGEAELPYWLSLDVTGESMIRAAGLAVLSATIAGVVPALRITGRSSHAAIQRAGAGGSGIRFGGVTGALVVIDVALSVAVVGFGLGLADQLSKLRVADELAGIRAEEFLVVEVRQPSGAVLSDQPEARRLALERMADIQVTLVDRLEAEPGVRRVAVAEALPRMDHPARPIEIEGVIRPEGTSAPYVRTARVDVGYLDALSQPVLSGRGFARADLGGEGGVAVVNTVFVERFLGGEDPLGRRVRFASSSAPAPWMEIVGVVGHLGSNMVNPRGGPALYVPVAPGRLDPMTLGIHAAVAPLTLAPRIREIVAEVDPTLVLGPPAMLSSVYQGDWYLMIAVAVGLAVLVGVLMVLAASGIYAMMSFSVSERTREIGIRASLGAPGHSLVFTILRRSLTQIALGALIGLPLAARLFYEMRRDNGASSPLTAVGVAVGLAVVVVSVVALLSCLVPTRRVLRIQASDALRAEG